MTGISNGAILSNFLGAKFSSRIAAIAPVVGTVGGKPSHAWKDSDPCVSHLVNV